MYIYFYEVTLFLRRGHISKLLGDSDDCLGHWALSLVGEKSLIYVQYINSIGSFETQFILTICRQISQLREILFHKAKRRRWHHWFWNYLWRAIQWSAVTSSQHLFDIWVRSYTVRLWHGSFQVQCISLSDRMPLPPVFPGNFSNWSQIIMAWTKR